MAITPRLPRSILPSDHQWAMIEFIEMNGLTLYQCTGCGAHLKLARDFENLREEEAKQGIPARCALYTEPEKPILENPQGADPQNVDRDELPRARLDRGCLSTAIRPAELLRVLASKIESGEIDCDGLIVVGKHTPQGHPHNHWTYVSNLGLPELLLMVRLAESRAIKEYTKGATK